MKNNMELIKLKKDRKYKVTFENTSHKITILDTKIKKSSVWYPEEFIYGKGMFKEETDIFPNYVHGLVWDLYINRDRGNGLII